MNGLRIPGRAAGGLAMAAGLLMLSVAGAQEDADADDEQDPPPLDEIVVTGERDGDQKALDPRSPEALRQQVFAEFRQMREEREQEDFRASLPEAVADESGRVKWGYDARAELRMRRETALAEIDYDNTRPATLFRVEF